MKISALTIIIKKSNSFQNCHGTYLLIYLFILYLLLLKHDIKSSVIVQWDSEIIKNIFSSPWSFIMSSGVYGDVV